MNIGIARSEQSSHYSTITSAPLFITKYKPYSLDGFFASDKFKSVLRTLLEMDDLNTLFIGNTCSGKTILLHTLIREYYQLKPHEHVPDNNILYVNNLKEQGVSFFRSELKTFSQSHSTIYGKKKMVIIDDIDTMNEQSQQVFRNYIDKYRHNVHFLSVCTNIQKVIESFQSRMHILRIESSTEAQIEELYDNIVSDNRLIVAPDAKVFLLKYCKYSIRSLINHMEKIWILDRPITIDTCVKLCGIDTSQYEKYLEMLRKSDLQSAIKIMYDIYDYGYSVIDVMESLFAFIKMTDLVNEEEKYKIIVIFCKYITVFYTVHENVIELAFFTNKMYRILAISPMVAIIN
jgi:DNA polymerase III delta prime subunit